MIPNSQDSGGIVQVKINREKLNTLLKSGLNPEVKTRKHLAEKLDLDPTSLTRWFSTRDRLGNPRYPVVPDRHINNILMVFNLDPQCFELDDEAFHRYCFELAIQRQEEGQSQSKKLLTRQDKVDSRRLSIPMSEVSKRRTIGYLAATFAAVVVVGVLGISIWPKQDIVNHQASVLAEEQCWQGFAEGELDTKTQDQSDPCHYRKLLYRAINQLKADNQNQSETERITVDATGDYIAFLSQKLEQRNLLEKAVLNYELGRNQLIKGNEDAALEHFLIAQNALSEVPVPDKAFLEELQQYIDKAQKGR